MAYYMKTQLQQRQQKIRRSRISMAILLLIEAFILLLHFPGFLAVDAAETWLISARNFLVGVLWPAGEGDMDTYKGVVYEVCTVLKALPYFNVIVQVIIYFVPGLFVLSFIRVWILQLRINAMDRAPVRRTVVREKKPTAFVPRERERTETESRPRMPDLLESGVPAAVAEEANRYCREVREACDNPFREEPGIRILVLSGDLGMGGRKDYVIPWDANGRVDLDPVIEHPVRLVLEKNRVYLEKNGVRTDIELERYVPFPLNVQYANKQVTICAITWLGGLNHD